MCVFILFGAFYLGGPFWPPAPNRFSNLEMRTASIHPNFTSTPSIIKKHRITSLPLRKLSQLPGVVGASLPVVNMLLYETVSVLPQGLCYRLEKPKIRHKQKLWNLAFYVTKVGAQPQLHEKIPKESTLCIRNANSHKNVQSITRPATHTHVHPHTWWEDGKQTDGPREFVLLLWWCSLHRKTWKWHFTKQQPLAMARIKPWALTQITQQNKYKSVLPLEGEERVLFWGSSSWKLTDSLPP